MRRFPSFNFKTFAISLLLLGCAVQPALAWKPLFVGHRGCYRGVENTVEAFRNGVDFYHYQGLECDVRVTKDGHYVISHDETTARVGGNLTVAQATLEELQAENYTQTRGGVTYTGKICTMAEYLDICKEKNVFAVIELKYTTGINTSDMSNFPGLAQLIMDKGMTDNVIFLTSMTKSLEYVRTNYPQFKCQFLCYGSWKGNEGWCRHFNIEPSISVTYYDIQTVNTFRRLGLKVATWTVNSEANYLKYGNMGVYMMTCDYLRPDDMPELEDINWGDLSDVPDPLELKCDTVYSFTQYDDNLPADFPNRTTKQSPFNTAMQAAVVDGLLYTNDCKTHTMLAFGKNGREESKFAGTNGTGIATDDAGNLVVRADSMTTTPNRLVIYPKGSTTPVAVDFTLLNNGQTYFIAASGDVMSPEGGFVYFYPKGHTVANFVKIAEGKYVDTYASGDLGHKALNTSLIIPLSNDTSKFVFQMRTDGIYLYDNGNVTEWITGSSGLYAPLRNTSVGGAQFELAGHTLFVHPSGAVYNGGFTIRDMSSDEIDVLCMDDMGNGGLSSNLSTGSFFLIEPIDSTHCYLYNYTMGNGYAKYQLYVGEPIQNQLKGDINGDGVVNVADVTALVNLILDGKSTPEANVNDDDSVNVADVSALVNIILGQ